MNAVALALANSLEKSFIQGDYVSKTGLGSASTNYNIKLGVYNGELYALLDKTLKKYNKLTDMWTLVSMDAGTNMATVVFGSDNKIHSFGGVTSPYTQHKIYDLVTNTISTGVDTPAAMNLGAGKCIGNKIYVIGGQIGTGGASKRIDIFNLTTGLWETGPTLATGKLMLNTFILNGNIYICGGNNNSSATSETIMYEVSSNTLIAKANMNIARERHAATADKYYGYVFAGYPTSTVSTSVEKYDPVKNKWSGITAFPYSDFYMGAIFLGMTYTL